MKLETKFRNIPYSPFISGYTKLSLKRLKRLTFEPCSATIEFEKQDHNITVKAKMSDIGGDIEETIVEANSLMESVDIIITRLKNNLVQREKKRRSMIAEPAGF